jgi:hypothetical protein
LSKLIQKPRLGDILIGFAITFGITVGVNFQVGDNLYTSNTVYRVLALLFAISLAFFGLLLKGDVHNLELSKIKMYWIIAFVSYSLYLASSSPDLGRFILGTADRNLGGITVSLAVLFFLVGRSISRKLSALVLLIILLNSIIQVVIVCYQKFLQPDILALNTVDTFQSPPVVGTFYNANPLSFFLGIVASGLCGLLIQSGLKKREIVLASIALIFLCFGLFLSSSAQGFIGLSITTAALLVGRFVRPIRQRFSAFMTWLYGLVLAIFFLAITFISISPRLNVSGNSYLERLEIYKTALQITVEHLFFGAGTDRFASEYGKFTLLSELKLVDNAHSVPLQIVSTQGLLGLLFFFSFVFWILRLRASESLISNPYWFFWQASFFSFAVIGIIGIEHPVITSIGFLSAGVLSSMSQEHSLIQKKENYKVKSKFAHSLSLLISVFLLFVTFHFVNGELKAGNVISQLSQRRISVEEFDIVIRQEHEKIYNARVLLNAGEAYIAIGNQVGALKVANTMLYRFPDDQRTSALFFSIAKTWNDEKAYGTAIRIRDQLFPKAKGL